MALALSACGGDDEQRAQRFLPDLEAPEGHSTEAARKRFNDVCFATDRALDRAERQEYGRPDPDDPPTNAQVQRFVDEVEVPTRRGAITSMRRIDVPPQLEVQAAAYLDAYEAGMAALAADLAVIRDPAIQDSALSHSRALAGDAGLARCATQDPRD